MNSKKEIQKKTAYLKQKYQDRYSLFLPEISVHRMVRLFDGSVLVSNRSNNTLIQFRDGERVNVMYSSDTIQDIHPDRHGFVCLEKNSGRIVYHDLTKNKPEIIAEIRDCCYCWIETVNNGYLLADLAKSRIDLVSHSGVVKNLIVFSKIKGIEDDLQNQQNIIRFVVSGERIFSIGYWNSFVYCFSIQGDFLHRIKIPWDSNHWTGIQIAENKDIYLAHRKSGLILKMNEQGSLIYRMKIVSRDQKPAEIISLAGDFKNGLLVADIGNQCVWQIKVN